MTKTGVDESAWKEAVVIGADKFTDPSDYEGVCVHFRDCNPSYCAVLASARTYGEANLMSACGGFTEGCRLFRI